MKPEDRIKAVQRSEEYLRDWETMQDEMKPALSKKIDDPIIKKFLESAGISSEQFNAAPFEQKLCRIWQIKKAYPPISKASEGNGQPWNVFDPDEDIIREVASITEPPLIKPMIIKGGRRTLEGKGLYLKVNMTSKKEDLMNRFEDIIDYWRKGLPPKKKRDRGPDILNYWAVYDLHHFAKYTLTDITKLIVVLTDQIQADSKVEDDLPDFIRNLDFSRFTQKEIDRIRAVPTDVISLELNADYEREPFDRWSDLVEDANNHAQGLITKVNKEAKRKRSTTKPTSDQ